MPGKVVRRLVVSLLLAALLPASGTARGQEAGADGAAHYLVVSLRPDGTYELLFHRRVGLARPLVSRSEEELALASLGAGREDDLVSAVLLDRAGQVAFRDSVELPRWIRGEFHGEQASHGGWAIEEHRFPWEPRVFVVRVPAVPGARLLLDAPFPSRKGLPASFDLAAVEAAEGSLPLARAAEMQEAAAVSPLVSGDPANRVDLLILGDGYTSSEAGKFAADVANLEGSFFNLSPYSTYKNFVNVVSLFTASAQSGADHPPYNPSCTGDNRSCCADPGALTDPKAGTYVNTAFNGRYCAFNTHRLALVDSGLALTAAAAYPNWDRVLVLINDSTYGGGGGFVLTASTHEAVVDVARHEFGHSFTGLTDEYDAAFPGFPSCNDVAGSPCEANVTNQTSRTLIKWAPWISPSTPVPTPEEVGHTGAGLFEGARYLASGMYRHRDTECLMHFLGKPFGEVCGQEYVLRLYRGGWGNPSGGIDPIEPGQERPLPGTVFTRTGVYLSVGLLGPVGGPPLDVVWKVDGAVVPGAKAATFGYFTSTAGSHQVRLEVRDTTSLVHPAMAGTLLQSAREWTVVTSGTVATSFYTLTPCRVLDTRDSNGPYGGPVLSSGSARSFALVGRCGIPAGAKAVSANLTVTQPTQRGHVTAYPLDSPTPPLTSTVNFSAFQTRGNNAVLPLGEDGGGTVVFLPTLDSGTVHIVLDVNGYFL